MDSSEFRKGTTLSRGEVSQLKREMRSTQSPMERMETDLMKLGQLAKKDAIAQEVYNRKLAQYNKHLLAANRNAGIVTRTFGKLSGAVKAYVAAWSIGSVVSAVQSQIDRIDKLSKTAQALGTDVEFLTRFQFISGQSSGLTDEQTLKGLEKFTRRLSEAAHGAGEAQGAIKELGLDARMLASQSLERSIFDVSAAMREVTSESDRLRIATKLFDDEQAKLHITLSQSEKDFQALGRQATSLGSAIDNMDVSQTVLLKDTMGELNLSMQRFSTTFTTELAPSITTVIKEAEGFIQQMSGANDPSSDGSFANRNSITIGDASGAYIRTFGQFLKGDLLAATNVMKNLNDIQNDRVKRELSLIEKSRAEAKAIQDEALQKLKEEKERPKKEAENLAKAGKLFADEFMLRLKNQFPNDDPFGLQQQQADWKGMWDSTVSKFWEELPKHRPEPDDPFGLGKQDQFTAGTTGPSEAIWANTSEAFAIQNRMAFVDTLKDPTKQTANNTSRMVFLLEQMRQENSDPIDGGGSLNG